MKNFMIVCVAALSLVSVAGCKKKGGMGEAMAKMGEYKDKMCACKDSACAQKVSDEMTKWSQEMAKDQKDPPKMSEEETKKATQVSEEMGKCMQKAMTPAAAAGAPADPAAPAGGAAPAAGGAAPAAGGGDLPKECQDYKDAIAKLANCDKMPQAARDSMKTAFDQASTGWANLPAEAKANLATACKAGADAVMQSGKAACGW